MRFAIEFGGGNFDMSWHIGASIGHGHQRPLVEVIRTLADAGFLGIELPMPAGNPDTSRRAEIEAVGNALRATGMRAVAMHVACAGLADFADPDPRQRDAAIDDVMTVLEVLAALQGRVLVVQPTGSPRAVPDVAARLQHACASVRILQSACAAWGMTLAIESPPRHLIGGLPDEFARLLAAAGPEARVCLDIGHILLEDWEAFADLATGRLAHVHAPDTDSPRDDPWMPGHGSIDWSRVARALDRMKYDAWLMLELGSPSEPLAQYFHRSAQHLRDRLDIARGKSRPAARVVSETSSRARVVNE